MNAKKRGPSNDNPNSSGVTELTWWDIFSAIEWLALQGGQPVDIAEICLLVERGPLGIAGHLDALREAGLIDYAERGIVLLPPAEGGPAVS